MDNEEKVPHGWIKVKSKTRADKFYYYHKERKISVWKLSDCNDESKIQQTKSSLSKTPKRSPKKESKLSNHSIVIEKRNLAEERLKKLQTSLKEEAKRGKVDKIKIKPNKETNKQQVPEENNAIISKSTKSLISPEEVNAIISGTAIKPKIKDPVKDKVNGFKSQETPSKTQENDINNSNKTIIEDDESFKMEVDEQLDKSTESLKDFEEPMEWEDIDVVKEVQNIRTKVNVRSNSSIAASQVANKLSKNDFYIIVDTNVLLSNLTFVKEIKSKPFKGNNIHKYNRASLCTQTIINQIFTSRYRPCIHLSSIYSLV